MLPERAGDANKGSFGRTLIVAGSPNYPGAALLATSAATRSGAGLVFLATREPVYRLVAGRVEEAIYYSLPAGADGEFDVRMSCIAVLDQAPSMSSLLIGPGLGQAPATVRFVEQLAAALPEDTPTVLDADALNILARVPGWWERIAPPKVLTPHPGEMARLMDRSVADVQADRPGTALEAAKKLNATVVLKGAATIIASPDGRYRISPWVNSGLARGGTGDVLAGLLAGLLAQMPEDPFDAATLAVYVHGLAGELAREHIGEIGMNAGDVAELLPAAFIELTP
jgi:NAD(P)H-hydrate epimerase